MTYPKAVYLTQLAGFHAITHPSVSRKHFELHVGNVAPGASVCHSINLFVPRLTCSLQAHLHTKTKLTVRDLGSKVGTFVDGVQISKNGEKTLDKSQHNIKLGSYTVLFR